MVTQDGKPARITLTPKAVERLGIRDPCQRRSEGRHVGPRRRDPLLGRTARPSSTPARDNVYIPAPMVVDDIAGDTARLSAGPAAGTQVVTTGAAELYGAEIGVGGGH